MPSWETRRSSFSTARKGTSGQWLQRRLLLGEGLDDHRRVVACRRGLATVSSQWRSWALRSSRLRKRAGEEEVLADVAERPLDLALGLGPVGPAGLRLEAVMAGEVDQSCGYRRCCPSASSPSTAVFIRS